MAGPDPGSIWHGLRHHPRIDHASLPERDYARDVRRAEPGAVSEGTLSFERDPGADDGCGRGLDCPAFNHNLHFGRFVAGMAGRAA